jgi:hypothetical protein
MVAHSQGISWFHALAGLGDRTFFNGHANSSAIDGAAWGKRVL